MQEHITDYIDERLNKLHSQLIKAKQSYYNTKDSSWEMKIQEIIGRMQELENVYKMTF